MIIIVQAIDAIIIAEKRTTPCGIENKIISGMIADAAVTMVQGIITWRRY